MSMGFLQKYRFVIASTSMGVLCSAALLALVFSVLTSSVTAQEANQSPFSGSSGSTNPYSTTTQSPNQGPTVNGNAVSSAMQNSVSVESLIAFLQSHPELLVAARNQIARAMGVDPQTVSTQQVFDRLRQDPSLASKVAEELQKRGYYLNSNSGLMAMQQNATMPVSTAAA